jgi:hypothetical protein
MKHYIVRTIAFATLSLGLANAASAQVNPGCSNARLAGSWGYTKTGTLYLPTGAAPFASIGTLTFHADGNVSGKIDVSVGGSVGKAELIGTFDLDSDCLGTMTFDVFDPSGKLLRTVSMSLVLDDNARELRGLMTSLVLPNGLSLPSAITGIARRLFPNQANEQ